MVCEGLCCLCGGDLKLKRKGFILWDIIRCEQYCPDCDKDD